MNYKNIGNLGNCNTGKRFVKSQGLIETPNLVTKLYTMLPKDASIDLDSARRFIKTKIEEGEIIPHLSGMGFTILSPGVLNSSVWGEEFPVLSKNEVYFFNQNDLSDARRLDLNVKGESCAFERIIAGYEALHWLKYLKSEKKEKDKEDYFNSFLETILE